MLAGRGSRLPVSLMPVTRSLLSSDSTNLPASPTADIDARVIFRPANKRKKLEMMSDSAESLSAKSRKTLRKEKRKRLRSKSDESLPSLPSLKLHEPDFKRSLSDDDEDRVNIRPRVKRLAKHGIASRRWTQPPELNPLTPLRHSSSQGRGTRHSSDDRPVRMTSLLRSVDSIKDLRAKTHSYEDWKLQRLERQVKNVREEASFREEELRRRIGELERGVREKGVEAETWKSEAQKVKDEAEKQKEVAGQHEQVRMVFSGSNHAECG